MKSFIAGYNFKKSNILIFKHQNLMLNTLNLFSFNNTSLEQEKTLESKMPLLVTKLPKNKLQNNIKVNFLDICSGIGGGRLALENLNFNCIGFAEINEKAIKTYKTLFFNDNQNLEKNFGNVMNLEIEKLPSFDILIGGFPCQSFSVLGKREGIKDERGQVIFGILKILKHKQPNYFILENVKGLLSLNKGDDFKNIVSELENCGYHVFYKVLNSNQFGVPQSRERIYFVGVKRALNYKNFIFPNNAKQKISLQNLLSIKNDNEITKDNKKYTWFVKYLQNKYNNNKYSIESLLKENFLIIDTRQSDIRFFKEHLPTLRAGRQGLWYIYNNKIFELNKIQALLAQGFSLELANKTNHIPSSNILTQAGNAMTVSVIEAIGLSLYEVIKHNNG